MGSKGFMVVDQGGFQIYKSAAADVSGEAARGAGAGGKEKYEQTMTAPGSGDEAVGHMKNFLEAVKSRDYKSLHADIEIGARSAAFCHLANIAYRVGRQLKLDTATGQIQGDEEATKLMTRDYRPPYVVPETV